MSGLRRRDVLAAVGGVGLAGAFAGSGTVAMFRESEAFAAGLRAGALDVRVEGGDGCVVRNDRVALDLTDLNPGACGDATLCGIVDGNPAWLWLRATCPTDAAVFDAVFLRVRYANGTVVVTDDGTALDGTARRVFAALADGVRLDPTGGDAPVAPGDRVCLTVEWGVIDIHGGVETACAVDADALDDPAAFAFEFGALQARHASPALSPWTAIGCQSVAARCVGCRELGKVDDIDGRLVAGTEYAVGDSGYAMLVDNVEYKDGDEAVAVRAFRLVEAGTGDAPVLGPPVCRVDVKGGSGGRTGGTRTHEVCPPTAAPAGEFDAPTNRGGRRPGISHVTVYTCGVPPRCW
ncbi:hypothetical protein [Salarchaeum sp. JOR-1]|uniref:hypothetical protein n=1 Tax=Salarchaeum sp. JOR-1 TaxID=2599399 RepID=UPI001198B0F2|nr:hypothetical protein [Salarchaeum sp. JOR-1]QDX39996.1 hypothetical protein FQU85_03450 [Salarchaeum sp. JOR-1]